MSARTKKPVIPRRPRNLPKVGTVVKLPQFTGDYTEWEIQEYFYETRNLPYRWLMLVKQQTCGTCKRRSAERDPIYLNVAWLKAAVYVGHPMKCKHPDATRLLRGPTSQSFPFWLWCTHCGATRHVRNIDALYAPDAPWVVPNSST